MDKSKILEIDRINKTDRGFVKFFSGYGNFNAKNDVNVGGFVRVLKLFLLKNVGHGVDTLFLAQKSRETNARRTCICGRFWEDENGNGVEPRRKKPEPEFSSQYNRNVCEEPSLFVCGSTSQSKEDFINASKGVYDEFPLNIITFLVVMLMKSLGFQINLLVTFLTIPLYLSYFWYIMMMFPFRTFKHIRRYLMKKVNRVWDSFASSVTSFIFARIKAPKSVVMIVGRMSRAFLCSIYVWCALVGLLVLGFVMGLLLMRIIVEEPVEDTSTLNFDYSQASPVAFVPMTSSALVRTDEGEEVKDVRARAIPYNHKLQLTVSLTLPESEHNQNLGVFQVKVELLSTNGKVTASQSYPCILKYKSQPIRHIQTFIKAGALLAGFESESQTLNIKMAEFTERLEPTGGLKVSLVQRAEFQPGAGIPEIYAATVAMESELPQLKRVIWIWRRTVFIWASFAIFFMELILMLLICRPLIIPSLTVTQPPRLVVDHSKPKSIAWYKG